MGRYLSMHTHTHTSVLLIGYQIRTLTDRQIQFGKPVVSQKIVKFLIQPKIHCRLRHRAKFNKNQLKSVLLQFSLTQPISFSLSLSISLSIGHFSVSFLWIFLHHTVHTLTQTNSNRYIFSNAIPIHIHTMHT